MRETNKLFTIHQVSRCSGFSRSTLMRLEDRGLLVPAFTDPETGYRRYDNDNVAQVMQIRLFLGIGMSYDDIALYYRCCGNSPELLARLEARFQLIRRAYEEIRLRMDRREHLSFEFVNLPRYVCYAREYRGAGIQDRFQAMYGLYHEAVEKGYHLLASEPLFVINKRTDYLEGRFTDTPCNFVCCVPLEPDSAPEEAVVYPPCRGFSCLGYGDYSRRASFFNELGRELRARGLKPAGDVRVLGLVAPYVGRDISPDCYVSRLVVPVEA